jgi:uncharacterized protein (DUF58 family)
VTEPHASGGGELQRAARILVLRSRREATGPFAGDYASAFRGGGLEFEESRPYVPGDDVRSIDWNATARGGEPFVKRFREERDQTLLFALDVSASMAWGSRGGPKSRTAAHALALMAAAAGRAGDRMGLVAFDDCVRAEVQSARGAVHGWRVIRAASLAGAASAGRTDLRAGLAAVRSRARRRAVVALFSDFRDPQLLPPEPAPARLRAELADLARRHDLVAGVVYDVRDEEVPAAGPLRLADPEGGAGPRVLDTGSARVRRRYAEAWRAWRERLERELCAAGADVVWLRSDRSPLQALGRFFQERAARRVPVAQW